MVAIVSGNSLGLELTSLGTLGNQGTWGAASQGGSGEQVYVNAATGNLVVQRRDDFLASRGLDNQAIRTYNSLGLLSDDNADNWSLGVYAQQIVLTGTVNTAGSTLIRTARDGSQAVYNWDAARACYITSAGSGAHDTIVFDSASDRYERTDGTSGELEKYNAGTGKLQSVTDADGNTNWYTYTGDLLIKVADKSGENVWYDYTGTQLTRIRVEYRNGTDANGNTIWATRNTVSYGYDTSGRLSTVTVDLTPEDGAITDGKVYKTTYTYDGTSQRIKTLTQTDGSSLTFTYVQVGSDWRVDTITDALGSVTNYDYDTTARRTTVTDPLGKAWVFDYDAAGQLVKLSTPTFNGVAGTNIAQSYTYDADGNVTKITNGDAETVTMEYDANGNQTRLTDHLGNVVVRTFSAANQLLTETTSNAATPALTNFGGISIVGNDIVKTGGTSSWSDASFRSSGGLVGGASVGFKPAQTDKAFMVGLNSDPGSNHSYASLDYALYCTAAGTLEVRELTSINTNKLTSTVTYAAGDDLRVTYDGSKVTYSKNGTVFCTTTVTISSALYADSSFHHVGAKISNLIFGATPTSGWVPLVAESGATVTAGGTVTKTGGANGYWDASVRSIRGETGGAMVSFKPSQTNKSVMVGLNSDPSANDSFGSIDYAMYCESSGKLFAYENGTRFYFVDIDHPTYYAANDTLQVIYDGANIKYIQNGNVLRQVPVSITAGLYLDSSFCHADTTIESLQFGRTGLTTVMAAAKESGMTIAGDTVTKTGGSNGYWDSAVRSSVGYAGQASVSFSPAQTDKSIFIGLNTDPDSNADWSSVDYAFYVRSDAKLEVREAGGSDNKLGSLIAYSTTDKLQITYDGSYVRYLKNGVELLKTAATITQPLYLDSSFAHVGAKVTGLRFSDRVTPELTTRYVYSASNPEQLRYVISAEGRVTQYKYSSYGERTAQVTYPKNSYVITGLGTDDVPTEAQLDAWVTAIGDLSGTVRKDYSYDARGLLSYAKEYLGANADGTGKDLRQTKFIYDPSGRLLQIVEEASGISGDETGSPTTTYTYDGLGRVLTVTDAHGALTSTVYTDSAQKAVVSYQGGASATSVYDKAGRLLSLARSSNGSTSYAYDDAGHLLMTTDPTGVKTFNLYDEAGRQVATVDGDGTLTETTYDKAGRVTRLYTYATPTNLALLVDANGVALNPTLASIRPATASADLQRWSFYDDAGRLVYEVSEDGALTRHDYDGAGRVVRTVRHSVAISTSGMSFASITALLDDAAMLAGAADDRSERYFYDADGLLIGSLDGEGYLTRHTYDQAGRRVQTRRYATAVAEASRAGGGALATLTPAANAKDQVETFFYDGRGMLRGQVDAEGYVIKNWYTDRGQMADQTRYASPLASTPAWTADLDDLILTIRPNGTNVLEPDDRKSYWRYTLDGQLVSSTNYEGTKTTYEYDDAGRLIKTTAGAGRTDARATQTAYDAWGRVQSSTSAEGNKVISAYDSANRLISTTDARGNKTLYYYDVDGRLAYTVNAKGEVEQTQYNTLGQRTATVRYATGIATTGLTGGLVGTALTSLILADAANDSKTSYSYDSTGRLAGVTDPGGAQNWSNYNIFGELREQWVPWKGGTDINVDKRQDTYTYDRRGLLEQIIRDATGEAATTNTEYDAFGRATKVTDANGKASTQVYDRLGRVVQTTDPLTKSVWTTYDAFDQVLTVKDALLKTTTYTYDRSDRSFIMTTPEGVAISTRRTAYGEIDTLKDGSGTTTTYSYDLDGQLIETKVGSTVIDSREYDAAGNLSASTDARGIRTSYSYDAANRVLTRTVEPTDTTDTDTELNLQTKWEYDGKGQAWKVTDPRGTVTEYTFDLEGRTIKQVVDPTGLALKTEWSRDAQGHALTVVDPRGVTTQYSYDRLGRRKSEVVDPGTGQLNLTRSYTYDDNGNVLTATDARGKVTRYRYDDAGRLTYTADPAGSVTRNEYDAKGQLVKQTRYVDTVTSAEEPSAVVAGADLVTRYAYDDDGRLEYTVDALGAVTKNEYDDDGNVVKITRYADTVTSAEAATAVVANAALDHVTRIEYDTFNRETYRANAMGQVTRNQYDVGGNLTSRTAYYNTVAAGVAPSAVSTSSSDRIERFVYDAAGRRTYASDATGAATKTSYDQNGNVTEIRRFATLAPGVSPDTVTADAANDRVASYTYDRANRRTWTVDELGYATFTAYDANGNVTAIRRYNDKPDSRSTPTTAVVNDTLDRVQRFEYDDANRLTKSTDALLKTEEFTYDGAGNKLTFKNKNSYTWTYSYDAVGRLLTETSPAVTLYTMVQNTDGTLTLGSAVSASVVTTLTYDSFGNLKTRTEADGRAEERTTSYDYDKLGRQIKVTYPSVMVHAEDSAELAANTRLDAAVRDETSKTPYTQTWYDVFGNAVSSSDRNGYASFKAYDAAGRVKYEVDALGYVTEYWRNAFGEATGQKRYFTASGLAGTAPSDADKGPTVAEIDAVVGAAGFATSSDRYLGTAYDKAGRVNKVSEPYAYTYNASNGRGVTFGKQTTTVYNAFGEVIQVGELVDADTTTDPDTLTFQYTYHYYDLGGRKTATADAGGYLTKFEYDSEGNLTKQVEYDNQMTVAWDADGYTAPAADATFDRTTSWAYDKLNRKTGETKVGATIYSSSTSTTVATAVADLTTSYGYDALGNLTRTTDAAGGITYTYYDALGRISAIAAPSRTSTADGSTLIPVVEFRRDAHGNVLCKVDRANTATGVTESAYTVTANSALDRVTNTLYDVSGNARQIQDALGYQHYNSYTADGKLAKSWQTVTDNDSVKTTLYAAYYFDQLGRLLHSYAPSPVAGQAVSTNYRYNAFGEVEARGKNLGWQEYFAYDNAGRMWKTNTGDGRATVYLYDLLGRQTAEITSAGSGRSGSTDVDTATSASQAAGWSSTRRINIKYDALGHVIERQEAERLVIEGGVTIRKASATATVAGSMYVTTEAGGENGLAFYWGGSNSANFSWTTLAYLGAGDVKVDLTYQTQDTRNSYGYGSAPVAHTESQIFAGYLANTGAQLNWTDSSADQVAGKAGISAISRVVVSKRNINGDWVAVIDRAPSAGRAFGDYGTQVEIGSPVDPTTSVNFKYRLSGATTWTGANSGLTKFGDSHWFDTSALSGTYEYEVWLTDKDAAAVKTESGTFVAKADDTDDSAKANNWERPVIAFTRDRWGNTLSQSDPRNTTWKTVYTYNRDNQVITEKRPDPSNGDQNTNSPTRNIYYDKVGQQRAVQDERGNVNTTEWDAGGNLTREVHADGGKVTYFYDAFGQKVQMVDSIGNTTTDKASATYKLHTTLYTFDRLGRQTTAVHGDTDLGAVSAWHVDGSLALVSDGKKDLQETFTYDAAGRKLSQTNGAGEKTQYWYDRAGNLVKTKQPSGQSSSATFDGFGHKASETDANGNKATWGYNYFGQLDAHMDIGGATYSYAYDTAGQLTAQSNVRNGVAAQNLTYAYDAAGQLIRVSDSALGETTTTAYDMAGHHLREKVVRNGQMFQDNHLSYDTLGRLVDSADDRAHLTFAYDAAGNRTKVTTHVRVARMGDDDVEDLKDGTRYFLYDAMNRQTVVDAIDSAGTISTAQGHKLTYDLNGNRKTDYFWGNKVTTTTTSNYSYDDYSGVTTYYGDTTTYSKTSAYVTETYGYDAVDRLQTVDRDGTLVDQRWYDAAGRVVQSGPTSLPAAYTAKLNEGVAPEDQVGMEVRRQRYDANGRLLYQRVWKSDGTSLMHDIDYEGIGRNSTVLGYDSAGNVLAYEFKNYDGDDYTNTTTVTLTKFEGYAEQKTNTTSTKFAAGSVTSSYDANGYLVGVDDATEYTLDKAITNDAAGRVLRVYQNGNSLYNSIVNGEVLGKFGVGPNELDPRTSKNQANFQQVAEFGFGYRSITGSYPAPSVGAYAVRQGDSLQAIAQAAYGDSSQWWRIAQANGLQSDRDLRVGQTLTLPSAISGTSNNTGTFKPYSASDVVGDTSPNLPQPKNKGCGAVGMIIMIVVAVVATVFTAGAAAMAMAGTLSGASLGGIMAAGGAALTGGAIGGAVAVAGGGVLSTGAMMAAAAIGGAVGSIVSQGVGIAIGAQDHFSWKQVAASSIGSAVGAGVGGAIAGQGASQIILRAAITNAMTQGISVAAGLQDHFSWTGVAAAAVGSAVGQAANAAIGPAVQSALGEGLGAKLVTGTLAGIASAATVAELRGGRFSMQQAATDAFGNALGGSIADSMQSAPDQSDAEWQRLKRYEGAALEQEAANNRTSLNAFNRDNDPYYSTSYENWPDQTGAESARLNRYEGKARAMENFNTTSAKVWADQDAQAAKAFLKEQHANADAYRRELAAEKARAVVWDGGAGGGRGFVHPPADANAYGARGHYETRDSYDAFSGVPTGGTERIWVSDDAPSSYGEVKEHLKQVAVGFLQSLPNLPSRTLNGALDLEMKALGWGDHSPVSMQVPFEPQNVEQRVGQAGGDLTWGLLAPVGVAKAVGYVSDAAGTLRAIRALDTIETGLGNVAPTGGDVNMLTSLDVQGIRAQRVLVGDNGKVAVIGRSMGDFTQRGEFGVVDFTRVLRNDLGFDTELFAGKQIQPEWFQEVQALREIHGVDILPDDVIRTTEIYKQNMLWAQKLVDQGYTVVDIGNPGFRGASPFYDGESSTVFNSGTASKTIDVSDINGYKPRRNP